MANIWNKSLERSVRPWFSDPEKGWPNSDGDGFWTQRANIFDHHQEVSAETTLCTKIIKIYQTVRDCPKDHVFKMGSTRVLSGPSCLLIICSSFWLKAHVHSPDSSSLDPQGEHMPIIDELSVIFDLMFLNSKSYLLFDLWQRAPPTVCFALDWKFLVLLSYPLFDNFYPCWTLPAILASIGLEHSRQSQHVVFFLARNLMTSHDRKVHGWGPSGWHDPNRKWKATDDQGNGGLIIGGSVNITTDQQDI
jgi:hypothetical protein